MKNPLLLSALALSALLSACSNGMVTETTPPTVALTGINSTVTQAGAVTLAATASDASGIKNVTFYVDGVQVGSPDTTDPYSVSYNWTANGTYTVKAIATDNNGNTNTATQTVTVAIPASGDTTPPTLSVQVQPTVTAAGNVPVTIAVSDNVGVTTITGTVTNGVVNIPLQLGLQGGTASVPVSSIMNGNWTITVTACDAASNCTTKTANTTVNIP